MDITPLIPKGRNLINSYNESGFVISEKNFSGSIILMPTKVLEIPLTEKDLLEEEKLLPYLENFFDSQIEILLIGTGKSHLRLSPNLKTKIKEKLFVSIDEMSTSAACRTFNILTLEDRKIAAILTI